MTMLLVAFLCFAVLIAAWLLAPGKPVTMPSLKPREHSDAMPADVGMQH
jgi:hypothetical protein